MTPRGDIVIWTAELAHHKRAERRCAIASFILATIAAVLDTMVVSGPLIACAIALGLVATSHSNQR